MDTADRVLTQYTQELTTALAHVESHMPATGLPLLELARTHLTPHPIDPARDVLIAGFAVPEALLYAYGARPFFLPTGSHSANAWVDDQLPRDADPVTRSVYGFLQNTACPLPKDALLLLPLVSDHAKKLHGKLMSAGYRVQGLAFPPIRDTHGYAAWDRQIQTLCTALSAQTHRHYKASSLRRALAQIQSAREAAHAFDSAAQRAGLDPLCHLFVLGSWYYTHSPADWTATVQALTRQLSSHDQAPTQPRVLLMGSPVCFPNWKIPQLLHSVGLSLSDCLDVVRCSPAIAYTPGPFHTPLRAYGRQWLRCDRSTAYVHPSSLPVHTKPIDGVIFHILKGQLPLDFDLPDYESQLNAQGIPVFRLETDYNEQDLEQLRIRLEAFSEMLHIRLHTKGIHR